MATAPGVSFPQYGEVAVFFVFLFLIFSITRTRRTGQPILTPHTSNNAVPPKGVAFWGHNDKGAFPPKSPKIPIGLAGNRKTDKRFRTYLHEGSTDKHQVHLNLGGL
jgi:hypothetical protein